MNATTLPVIVANDPDGGTLLRAPMVGVWSGPPPNGTFVEAGSCVGRLTQLGHRFELVLPDGVSGRVELGARQKDGAPVEYGEILLRIVPFAVSASGGAATLPEISHQAAGGLTVFAPTDGVFYRAPAKGARPYVVVGDRVIAGQPIGLIEVMKTFNPIGYGGAELPDEAEVVEVLVADEAEVRAGQPLVLVKPL